MKTSIIIFSIIALCTSPAFAGERRPARAVILLDFSKLGPPPVAAEGAAQSVVPQDLDAISNLMASQFTGVPTEMSNAAQRRAVQPLRSASVLGNPFTLYAISPVPAYHAASGDTSACAAPIYRPSLGFGRATEERRRILFPLVHRAACEVGLPIGLFDAVIMQESRYKPAAVSTAGAFGLAQLMPGTATQLGVDRYSLQENLRGGARYLKQHVNRFGRYDLALAAYNAGPGRVEKRWQVPAIAETQDYVRTIMGNWTGAVRPAVIIAARPLSARRAQLVFAPYQPPRY
jgi:soluble lytic murein transglycosylase-like protein